MTVISTPRRQKLHVNTADEKDGRAGGIVEPLLLFWTVSRILRCEKIKPSILAWVFLFLFVCFDTWSQTQF